MDGSGVFTGLVVDALNGAAGNLVSDFTPHVLRRVGISELQIDCSRRTLPAAGSEKEDLILIRVFISHQSADSALAGALSYRLKRLHDIDSYLDIIDPLIKRGEDLADHIRSEMTKCTQLLAVVSPSTKASSWVPWEVGVATEKDFPLATYSDGGLAPPEFLQKWPYLRTHSDLDVYAETSKRAERVLIEKREGGSESNARRTSTREFYNVLRSRLGQ